MLQPIGERGKLKQLRLELSYTQEDFAMYADIRVKTYRDAEQKGITSYPTAQKILKAQNALRTTRNMDKVTLEDLGLDIR